MIKKNQSLHDGPIVLFDFQTTRPTPTICKLQALPCDYATLIVVARNYGVAYAIIT